MKKYLKIAVSVTFLGILLMKVEWNSIYDYRNTMNLPIVYLVFLIFVLQFPISAYRWKKSLEIHDLIFPFLFLQKILCIGFFINTFLPTSIGGDGYRAWKTIPETGEKTRGISAILLERIIGLVVLMFLGFVGAIVIMRKYDAPAIKIYILAGVVAGILVLLGKIMLGRNIFGRALDRVPWKGKFDAIRENLQYIKTDKRNLLRVIGYSIAFQLLAITSIHLLFLVVGVNTDLADCAFIAAVAGIAAILPISINGIGVVEGSLVYSALQVGIVYDQAVIVALMLRILTIPLTLICGFIYFYDTARS